MEPGERMHRFTEETAWISARVEAYANERISLDPPPLDAPRTPAELAARVGSTITPQGIGAREALRLYVDELAPATITTDHPMFLAFVPGAPTKASILFDLAVSASSMFGGTWLEGAGGVYAVVATAGTTNVGIVDDLAGVAEACRDHGLWFHVDAAYGGAALCAPTVRHLFDGIEHADSVVIDPHKWLFAPYDVAALVYRDPADAAAAHTQHAAYLEEIN